MPEKVQHDSEFRVKKKKFALFALLTVMAVSLSACLFESEDTALSSWLNDQGLPDSYGVQTLTVNDYAPISAKAYTGKTVNSAGVMAFFGTQAGITHDLVFDVAFSDSAFFAELAEADSAASSIIINTLKSFYADSLIWKSLDSLPYEEELDLKVEWKLDNGMGKDFIDSVAGIPDSTWYEELGEWKADNSSDTTYEISVGPKDSLVRIELPSALVEDLKESGPAVRLQLRLSAPESKHSYRFYGTTSKAPQMRIKTNSETEYKSFPPFRMAEVISFDDACDECLYLHGGALDGMPLDSIIVEYPADKVLEALSEFYGDDFPYAEGNGFDVRQAVVLAELTMPRDDSEGYSEFGLPIQVAAGSYIDSLGEEIWRKEFYRKNTGRIKEHGHPNMVFYDGDSLSLQVSYGMRDLINKANSGRNLKISVRLSLPLVRPQDTVFNATDASDTSYAFSTFYDYARYDFGKTFSQPATLKLWLASKRGDEE